VPVIGTGGGDLTARRDAVGGLDGQVSL